MLGVTAFGIFLTPVFFYVIQWVTDLRGGGKAEAAVAPGHAEAGHSHEGREGG
jgi:hypothetical protein